MATSDPEALIHLLIDGDRRAVARAISIVEERRPGAAALLAGAHAVPSSTTVVGITGAPGVGKSTIVSGLIAALRADGRTVAVLAVDPSSPFSGGAVLGDRIRMQDHVDDAGVYVRSLASRGRLGGLSDAVTRAIVILEASGVDVVVVETVGVGQSETEIAGAADTTVVVVTPGWGDSVQAAKAGLLEIADVFVVNKSDLGGVDVTVRDLTQMLELGASREPPPVVLSTSARDGVGIDELLGAIDAHVAASGDRGTRRRARAAIGAAVRSELADRAEAIEIPEALVTDVVERRVDPWVAARDLLS